MFRLVLRQPEGLIGSIMGLLGLALAVPDHSTRARAEAAIGRFKQVIGDGLRSHTDHRRATAVDVAIHALNSMSEFGRPNYVHTA